MMGLIVLLVFYIMLVLFDEILFFMLFLMVFASLVSVLLIFNGTPWFGLIFFLIYVSGLLVLFGYMMAMSPNMINAPFALKYMPVSLLFFFPSLRQVNLDMIKINYFHDIVDIFNYSHLSLYLLITLMLFLSLVSVVNITYKAPSPLRNFL
uniref:NADH dehydrogenase subunit 6 n=1 Tax=Celleporella hyalina TaxID=60593 RepID=I6Q0X3_9BILA|nr:NADH dehydrogenase subunit 6 [Celleporella hyalina]AFJ53902.1 NADH dehydrogenase subunit 6 [Celleporella hyalina]